MIFGQHGLDLQYDANATYTVSDIWQHRRANCLAFTLLFVTLAREAGIQARAGSGAGSVLVPGPGRGRG